MRIITLTNMDGTPIKLNTDFLVAWGLEKIGSYGVDDDKGTSIIMAHLNIKFRVLETVEEIELRIYALAPRAL